MIESAFSSLGLIFFPRLILNSLALFVLIRFCFCQDGERSSASPSFYMFGIGIFIVTYSLKSIDISMGFAFGLFAIFSMLRYRTEVMSLKEMTYLFLVTVISLLSAVSTLSSIELLLVLSVIAVSAYVMEAVSKNGTGMIKEQLVRYEKIENIKPENYQLLIKDLRKRTGLDVCDVEITSIDFMQDSAKLRVFYTPHEKQEALVSATAGSLNVAKTQLITDSQRIS